MNPSHILSLFCGQTWRQSAGFLFRTVSKLGLPKAPNFSDLFRAANNCFSSIDVAMATSLSDKTAFTSLENKSERTAGLRKSSQDTLCHSKDHQLTHHVYPRTSEKDMKWVL